MILSRIKLRSQIYLVLLLLLIVVCGGGCFIIYFAYQIDTIHSNIIHKNLANYQMAENLENALVNQKGFVSYYYLDRDPEWLKQLGEYRQIFTQRLKEMKSLVDTREQQIALDQIEKEYNNYVQLKDQVINYYIKNRLETGLELHKTVRDLFFRVMASCETFKEIHTRIITESRLESQKKTRHLISSVVISTIIVAVLVSLLIVILITQILDPLNKLTLEAGKDSGKRQSRNDLQQLSQNVKGLIQEADMAQAKLKQNREILIQSEKLALVGKLAAGMAHSIRNPLTSVKMRLFALNRTLTLSESEKEDFEVIAEEIKRLDTIVQNFLEFSRPPKLAMVPISLTTVVDQSLQLLEHRLKSYNVTVTVDRTGELPIVRGDSEQLKEVFVNLIVNACESMAAGGTIKILEDEASLDRTDYVRVRLADSGPGIPEANLEKVFQPFFTTKEEGTGLGLAIASRIVEDHQGQLQVESEPGQGTTFSLLLPVLGEKD